MQNSLLAVERFASRAFLHCLPVLVAMTVQAQTAAIQFQSTPERTALLELYTSEGCSSCPPAEFWLSGFQYSPRLWRDFAPVEFHVDYWNYLGWNDAWSEAKYSERQRTYAQHWRSENIYTPEFVLDGKEWHNWFTAKTGPQTDGERVGVLTVTSTDRYRWQASFVPGKRLETGYDIHAALLAGRIGSDVRAGENKGRHLSHDFVVVTLVRARMTAGKGAAEGAFILGTTRYPSGGTLALTVWVTRAGQLESLQATGGWLVPPIAKSF
jgi:hypothetical protein